MRRAEPPGTLPFVTLRLPSPVLFAGLALVGCIDPLAEDDVPPRDIIFHFDPERDERPTPREAAASSHDWGVDPGLADRIDENDEVDEYYPRLSAFSGGERVWYWDFGTSPTFAAPLWRLVNPFAEGEEHVPVDHPLIWDVVPGDPAYSPYWRIYDVPITDKYNGERLISRRALDEALEMGLILPPQPLDLYANCPVVDENVRMQVRPGSFPAWDEEPCPGNESATCIQPHYAYYKGVRVAYFDSNGPRPIDPDGEMGESMVYELRRETESLPLSEPVRGVDITGDEDAVDTNDIFEHTPCSDEYTPVHETTEVFVVGTYASIDTNESETEADARNWFDLFNGNGSPRTLLVRGLEEREGLRNLAIENILECPE